MPISPITPQEFKTRWTGKFFTIFTGQAFSLFGSALVQFALVWHLTQKTGSAIVLATASLAAILPQVFLGPFIGTLVDRSSRRLVMILADSGIAAATLGLLLLFATGRVEIWHIYAIMFIRSVGAAFHWPAMSASTSLMVPEEHLARIAGLRQALEGLVGIVAPPVGALLIMILPTQNVLLIDIGTALMAVLPLLFIPIPEPKKVHAQASEEQPSYWQDLRAGFSYVKGWPGLMAIIGIAVGINFMLSPTSALMPLLITKHFGKGALELGFIDSAWGVGMIAGGILLSVWGGFKKRITTSLSGIVALGIGIVVVGLAPAGLYPMALAGMALVGIALPFTNGPIQAIMQATVQPNMQGRIMSLINSLCTAMMPLGLLIAGPVSEWLGIQTWYILAGVFSLLMGIAGFFIPAIISVESNRQPASSEVRYDEVPVSATAAD